MAESECRRAAMTAEQCYAEVFDANGVGADDLDMQREHEVDE